MRGGHCRAEPDHQNGAEQREEVPGAPLLIAFAVTPGMTDMELNCPWGSLQAVGDDAACAQRGAADKRA